MTTQEGGLTFETKRLLSSTIRGLRARMINDLLRQAEGDYRLSLPAAEARLPDAQARRRATLEAWIDAQLRAAKGKEPPAEARARLLREAVKEVAATWLLRAVYLKCLEARGLSSPMVVTGGWNSSGCRQFRTFAGAVLAGNESEGYALLLQLVCDEHALDLPSLFGEVGLERIFPLPTATLRELVERLDDVP